MNFKNNKEIVKISLCFFLLFIAARVIIDTPLDKELFHPPFFYFSGPEGSLILKFHLKLARATSHFVYLIGVACGEEIVFRGPLLLILLLGGTKTKYNKKVISYLVITYSVLSSYWFTLLHIPIPHQKITVAPYIFYFLLSVFLCYVTYKIKKIEVPILFHFLWNFFMVF